MVEPIQLTVEIATVGANLTEIFSADMLSSAVASSEDFVGAGKHFQWQ